MLELCKRPLETCFGVGDWSGGGAGKGFAIGDELFWQTNLRCHAFGEYSMATVQANPQLEDQAQVFASPSATYAGVFDGHGSPDAARFINSNLFTLIHNFQSEQGGLSADVLRKAFQTTEHEFLQLVRNSWIKNPQIALSGSCCLVAAISNDNLYTANLGDSRAVLGRKVSEGGMFSPSRIIAQRLTSDHNVGDEDVRKEVCALHPDDSHIVVYSRGYWRIKGIIQVSRAIGDIYLKFPEFNNLYKQFGTAGLPIKKAVITADPSISIRKLDSDDLFIILASDGLWEHITDQTAVEIVYKSPRVGIAKRLARAAMLEAAKKKGLRYEDLSIFEKGVRRQIHDDITVIVLYFDRVISSSKGVSNWNTPLFSQSITPVDVFSYNVGASDCIDDSPC
ncbi:hypothetical protein V2J09_021561 [Rumex salicifolius]